MKLIALLRGINAGKLRRVEMKRLKVLFESLGYSEVLTYINSGNVIFGSGKKPSVVRREIEARLKKEFGFFMPVLVKTSRDMQKISKAIPEEWENDAGQKSDVAYLFEEADHKNIVNELPVKRDYIDIRYVKGAILWNVLRKDYNKSHLNKIIGHKYYQFMTVRNVNTARFLGGQRFDI